MAAWPALVLDFPGPPGPAGSSDASCLKDLVSADLHGFDVAAILEQTDDRWYVCFRSAGHRAEAAALLTGAHGPLGLCVRAVEMDDEDWARRSQSSLRAVRVGRIVVAPPWAAEAASPAPDTLTIVIEPAMGFGSGHHATTRLCLDALQRIGVHGRLVVDIGTGSGVLALAAARLGASAVLAIDVDPDALDNARSNAAMNGSPAAVEFRLADFRTDSAPAADVVVANLTGGMLAANVSAVARGVAPGGLLVLSGITAEERTEVLAAFADGFSTDGLAEEEGWCCAVLRHDARQ
jgi:ribosomal protein L11 methyltransferase